MSVFISYSRKDHADAVSLTEDLRRRGVDVFIDTHSMTAGEPFTARLAAEIKGRPFFVLLVSADSLASKWVRREVHWARGDKTIIPVMLEMVDLPDELFFLRRVERVDFTAEDAALRAAALAKLYRALGLPDAPPAPAAPVITPASARRVRQIVHLQGHENYVWTAAFSPDGSLLATASADKTVRLWDVAGRVHVATLTGHRRDVNAAVFAPDGARLASAADDGEVRLWDVAARRLEVSIKAHDNYVTALTFTPGGSRLATGSSSGELRLWDLKQSAELAAIAAHDGRITRLTYSPDSRLLASASKDGTIRLWIDSSAPAFEARHSAHVNDLAFSPDGTLLASASYDKRVGVWRTVSLDPVTHIATPSNANAVAFSPDGALLAVGTSGKLILLYDTTTWEQAAALKGHINEIRSLAFSPDGTLLASSAFDRSARLWAISPVS